jgi:hypothetical protein
MSRKDRSIDSREELDKVNERRIEQIIDVVEKHTRTERHLEQNLDIISPKDMRRTMEIQRDREKEIQNLKNIVSYGKHEQDDELENLTRNYSYTNNYLEEFADEMDEKTLERTKEKQRNRKDQIGSITHTRFK